MVTRLKTFSLPMVSFAAFFLAMTLSGCADARWPSWATGEPKPEVIEAKGAVGVPLGQGDKSWPNLAAVPSKPPGIMSLDEGRKQIKSMENDRAAGESILNEAVKTGEVTVDGKSDK